MTISTRTLKTAKDPILQKNQTTKMSLKAPTSTKLSLATRTQLLMAILQANLIKSHPRNSSRAKLTSLLLSKFFKIEAARKRPIYLMTVTTKLSKINTCRITTTTRCLRRSSLNCSNSKSQLSMTAKFAINAKISRIRNLLKATNLRQLKAALT